MNKKTFILMGLSLFIIFLFSGCNHKNPEMIDENEAPVMEENSMKDDVKEEQEMEATEEVVGYVDISPEEAKMMIDENSELVVIDVSPKYDEGHLPGAVNYYLGDGSLDEAIPSLDKNATYLVYCHVDTVAIQGAQKLIDAGFENVFRLEGNYQAWVDAGYPIEK